MPVLKNARHEAFAQGLAKGLTAEQAYQEAGFKPHRGNASTLRANQNVLDRVAEIQSKAAEKAEWTAAERLQSLKTIHDAQRAADPRVAISAIAEANKMQGSHAPVKNENGEPGNWKQSADKTWREVLRNEKS